MAESANKILSKMLERLFSSLINGPSMNCKPHSSRQRIDLTQFARLHDIAPEQLLKDLLGEEREGKITARVSMPRKKITVDDEEPAEEAEKSEPDAKPTEQAPPDPHAARKAEEKAAQQAWLDQQSFVQKIRTIAEDGKTYEHDTGVHVLHIGFPLLSLPPSAMGRQRNVSRRILAPLAFVSVNLTLAGGATPSIVLECKNQGVDLVVANLALLSWLEQQTGKKVADLFQDESGEKPFAEICGIVQKISSLLEIQLPPLFTDEAALTTGIKLQSAPRSDDNDAKPSIVPCAVLGLFPAANEGLLRDMQALVDGEPFGGPIQSFVQVDASLHVAPAEPQPQELPPVQPQSRQFAEERLISQADPCQSKAVKLARATKGLVIHGPPGTGKSQTISNIIGDHLARGQRVLLVCDKRTALDVVINRLQSLGLSQFCAVVHDAQRDQRELYKAIREQLESLADAKTDASAEGKLATMDGELQRMHGELTAYHAALMHTNGDATSFHDLIGQWLALPSFKLTYTESALQDIPPKGLEEHVRALHEILERGETVHYPTNPWVSAAGISLANFLSTPMDRVRASLARCLADAQGAHAAGDPNIPPWDKQADLLIQGNARVQLADQLDTVLKRVSKETLSRWTKVDARGIRQARQKLIDAATFIESLKAAPLDGELGLVARSALPTVSALGEQIAQLDRYLAIAAKWYAFFCFTTRSAATKVLSRYNLAATIESATRLRTFLAGLRARLLVRSVHSELVQSKSPAPTPSTRSPGTPGEGWGGGTSQPPSGPLADDVLIESITEHSLLFDLLNDVASKPELAGLEQRVRDAISAPENAATLLDGLRKSLALATALTQLQNSLKASALFAPAALDAFKNQALEGKFDVSTFQALHDQANTLEGVLRIREGLASLEPGLRIVTTQLLEQSVGAEPGLIVLRKAVLALEIMRRLKSDPQLQNVDAQKIRTTFEHYRSLDRQKKETVRQAIQHHWVAKQKERLLATTGSRLNSTGADLRRRLTIRGQKAMRLRQVVAVGNDIEGGDPLFDLRPVWMASPETVAQIFPRKAQFDVVVFDEASQCRLEEAMPVLLRANRVVIAGDPKQLPPTRFFESAVASSEDDEIETDQDLFEVQQGEIEDLLAAALNIEIDESYLDVHYRSRNADLIQFSNEHFYGSRLQAIPGHPSNRTRYAPLTLYKAGGIYDKRANIAEADRVCHIVQDLLKRADPPSIGIASFNMQQRDLILERLENLAAEDSEFARRFAEARTRRSASSFEGLFVKNLENVQGDERDHIIISTTFGPDPKGRFYRRFGPLGRAGGGRRLNVLVTRARQEVHLVTSIPESIYRALPPIPAGETPSGAWLLFSYLAYAESLAALYETNYNVLAGAEPAHDASVNVLPSQTPSLFAQALADKLAKRSGVGSDVHWGNEGFCVDLALHHPQRAEDVTIGVMCDMSRYSRAQDPVEWEVFRTTILEDQGWQLHRLWTPHFFRDRDGCTEAILKDVARHLETEQPKDGIKTTGENAER